MIVRNLRDLLGTAREVKAETWTSRRLLLADDRMGFSLHDTLIHAGTETRMCYRNHLEAVYCVAGTGSITAISTGRTYPISDGIVYALDEHDEHILRADTELRLVCAFNPPIVGTEVHDATGAYPTASEFTRRKESHDADDYRSRGEAWSFAERRDPVVYGSAVGPLTADEVGSYRRNGFVVKRGLFTEAEVASILHDAEALARGADPRHEHVICEPNGGAVRSLFRVHKREDALGLAARDPRLVNVARQLLGSPVYIHQSRINFKPAFKGEPFPWHSDFETWHQEDGMPSMRALSASLLLTKNTEQNGPLLVLPGSHLRFVRCAGETPQAHYKQSLRKQEYGVPPHEAITSMAREAPVESVTGPAGSVVFFDSNLMHGSFGNMTPLARHNLFLVYNSTENTLRAPYCGQPPRPDFLAERDFSPL